MRTFGSCATDINGKRIVLQERRSKIHFLNPSEQSVKKVEVDGCAITSGIRCDYLLICGKDVEYYVELKGANLKHAFDQLESTIKQLSDNPASHEKRCYVISSRSPLTSTELQVKKVYFNKHFNSSLYVKNIYAECPLKT